MKKPTEKANEIEGDLGNFSTTEFQSQSAVALFFR